MPKANPPAKTYYLALLRVACFTFAAIILAALASPTAFAKDLADGKWIEVSTANFRFRSAMSEKETVELARRLEMFRAAFPHITGVRPREPLSPMHIYVLRNYRDFVDMGGDRDDQSFNLPGMRSNIIVVHRGSSQPFWSETAILLHEYTHFLLRNQSIRRLPLWFDEGLAYCFSNVALRNEVFDVGLPHDGMTRSLMYQRWLPFWDILVWDRDEQWWDLHGYIYHMQSWLLMHYLITDPERNKTLFESISKFEDYRAAGLDESASFEQAFGMSANDLNRELKEYNHRNRYKFFSLNTSELVPDFKPIVRPVPKEQVSLDFGDIFLRAGQPDRAFESYMRLATGDKPHPRAQAGLGKVLLARNELDAAQDYFEGAVELAGEDPSGHLDLAEYWRIRAQSSTTMRERSEYLANARRSYTAAWKLDKSIPEVYAMLGKTYLMEKRDYPKAIEYLEEAASMIPGDLDVRLMLAEAYAAVDRESDALILARTILGWSEEDAERTKYAEEIVASLEAQINE